VYYFLSEAVKRRFILELRTFWGFHPSYRDDLVGNIQGKYAFEERPQYGIIVKMGSGNHVRLSPDNFRGTVESYVALARVPSFPGMAVEWVREDGRAIQDNRGIFPSPPGVYYIVLTTDTQFEVHPLLTVRDESVLMTTPTEGQLQQGQFTDGTLLLYEMPGSLPLTETTNYTANPATGEINLNYSLRPETYLVADYRYPGEIRGPFEFRINHAHNGAIPGVVVAFGREGREGDRQAVIIQEYREPMALEYGGRWSLSLDFEVVARDVDSQGYITDRSTMYLEAIARSYMANDGIEIKEVSLGGESEEVYDDNADDYYFQGSFSVSLETDWSLHVPLVREMRRVSPTNTALIASILGLTDDELLALGLGNNLHLVENLGLQSFTDPFYMGRSRTFEVIR